MERPHARSRRQSLSALFPRPSPSHTFCPLSPRENDNPPRSIIPSHFHHPTRRKTRPPAAAAHQRRDTIPSPMTIMPFDLDYGWQLFVTITYTFILGGSACLFRPTSPMSPCILSSIDLSHSITTQPVLFQKCRDCIQHHHVLFGSQHRALFNARLQLCLQKPPSNPTSALLSPIRAHLDSPQLVDQRSDPGPSPQPDSALPTPDHQSTPNMIHRHRPTKQKNRIHGYLTRTSCPSRLTANITLPRLHPSQTPWSSPASGNTPETAIST